MTPTRRLIIGQAQLWADRHELHRNGTAIRLPPRLVQLLLRLADTPGETVTREQLLEAAWQRRVVNDEVLSRSIADLRQALGDDPREPTYIATIPKLGYRLIAPVRPLPVETSVSMTGVEPVEVLRADSAVRSRWGLRLLALALLAISLSFFWRHLALQGVTDAPGLNAAMLLRAQPLTSAAGLEVSPRLSPDATQVAYAESAQPGSRIVVQTLSTAERRLLTDGSAWDNCPTWLGNDIVFVRRAAGRCTLMRQSLRSEQASGLAECAAVRSCPDIDGGDVLFTAVDRGLARLDIATGAIEQLTMPPDGAGFDVDPRRLHGTLYFSRARDDAQSLFRWIDGRAELVPGLPPSLLYGYAAGKSPALILASDVLGFRALVSFDPQTGETTLLGARGARYPDTVAGTIVFEMAQYDANLWLHRADGTSKQLTLSTRYDAYPQLAPDDRSVIYQSNRDGFDSLYQLDLSSGSERRLPAPEGERWAHPAFVDERRLLLTRYRGVTTDIVRYTLGADRAEPVGLPFGAHDARGDRAGRIYYLLGEGESQRLFRHDAAGTEEIGAMRVDQYAVGDDAIYVRRGTTIQRCRADCVTIDLTLDQTRAEHWIVVGSTLYAVESKTGHVVRVDGDHKAPTPWPTSNTLTRGITVSRDGSFAIVARNDALTVDLHWATAASQ